MPIILRSQLPESQYFAQPAITWHRLKDFITGGPLYYRKRHITGELPAPPQKEWGRLGNAYHLYALEGREEFLARVVATPETYPATPKKKDDPIEQKPWNMSANFCKDWVANETSKGKLVLSPDEYAQAIAIGENMRADPITAPFLRVGFQEITVEQNDERFPVPLRGRIDWLTCTSPKLTDAVAIIDPKGTVSLESFAHNAIKMGYHRQMAYYRKLLRDELGIQLPAILPAIEKGGTHRVRGYQLTDRLLDWAERQNEYDLDRLAGYYARNDWPLDTESTMRELDLPSWITDDSHQPIESEAEQEAAPW